MAGDVPLYGVADPVPRVTFAADSTAAVVRTTPDEMHRMMRDGRYVPQSQIMVPAEGPAESKASVLARSVSATTQAGAPRLPAVATEFDRPSSDEITVRVQNDQPGVVRILETFDEGWRTELNGQPVPIIAADDTYLGVRLPAAGDNRLRFTYHTPGAVTGVILSLASGVGLAALLAATCRGRNQADSAISDDATAAAAPAT
jgi:hypothetical protein